MQFYFIFIFVLFLMKKHIVSNSKKKSLLPTPIDMIFCLTICRSNGFTNTCKKHVVLCHRLQNSWNEAFFY